MRAMLVAMCGALVLTSAAVLSPAIGEPGPEPLPLDGNPWTGAVSVRTVLKFGKDGVPFTAPMSMSTTSGDFVFADQFDGMVTFSGSNLGSWAGEVSARLGQVKFWDYTLSDSGEILEVHAGVDSLSLWGQSAIAATTGIDPYLHEIDGTGTIIVHRRNEDIRMRQQVRATGTADYDGATRRVKARLSMTGALFSFGGQL